MRTATFLTTLPLLAALTPAQHTILFVAGATDRNTLALDATEVDLMRSDEIYEITPTVGLSAPARPFLPISLQYHYVGDLDGDSVYVEDDIEGPADTIDAILVKANTTGPVTPRDVFWSVDSVSAANIPGLRISDVVRYSGQGTLEFFVTHAQLNTACGLVLTSNTMNLDAIAQSAAGDLFFSQSTTVAINGIATADGDVLVIPASAITYDGNGNVSAIAAGSAVRIAAETDMLQMVINSGHRTSVGGVHTLTTAFELSGLEMDPAGGTWTSPLDAQAYPNLLFCWNDSTNDGAILTTAGTGTIATINGVPMGSTVATLGDHIGVLPDSVGMFGPNALGLIPQQAPRFTLQNWPRNQHPAPTASQTQTIVQLQTSGGTAFGFTILFWSVESAVANGVFPSVPAPPPFSGDIGVSAPIIIGLYPNDALGNAQSELIPLDSALMSGINLSSQALDFTTFALSTPSAMSFL